MVRPGKGGVLTYFGVLEDSEAESASWDSLASNPFSAPAPPVILGDGFDGTVWKSATLIRNIRFQHSFGGPQRQRTQVEARHVLLDIHLEDESMTAFRALSLQLDGLASWISETPLRIERHMSDDGRVDSVGLRYTRPQVPTVAVPGLNGEVRVETAPALSRTHSVHTLSYTPSLEVRFDADVPLSEVVHASGTLHDYIAVTTGIPMSTTRIRTVSYPTAEMADAIVAQLNLDATHPWSQGVSSRAHLLTRMPADKERWRRQLQAWVGLVRDYRPVIALLVDNLYKNRSDGVLFRDSELLHLAQAAEGFHRRKFHGQYISKGEHAKLIKKFKAELDAAGAFANMPTRLRQRIRQALPATNEFQLSERLSELLEFAGAPAAAFITDSDTFVGEVVAARNQFAHRLHTTKRRAVQGGGLVRLNLQLRCLLHTLFLRELGFTDGEINAGFDGYHAVQTIEALRQQGY